MLVKIVPREEILKSVKAGDYYGRNESEGIDVKRASFFRWTAYNISMVPSANKHIQIYT